MPELIAHQIDGPALERCSFSPQGERFGPLRRINVIVGPNNSGKSRLLRMLLKAIKVGLFVPGNESSTAYIQSLYELIDLHGAGKAVSNSTVLQPPYTGLKYPIQGSFNAPDRSGIQHLAHAFPDNSDAQRAAQRMNQRVTGRVDTPPAPRCVYVPSLRGFRSPKDDSNYFSKRTREDYFQDQPSIEIACGGDSYAQLKKLLLGDLASRNIVRSFEAFFSKQFLNGVPITLIPRESEEKNVHVTIGNEKERSIENIGDGLQHLLIILLSVYLNKKPVVLAIEEPELFLHPGYQTRLLDCFLLPELEHVQVFATTHSNHLINLSLDRNTVGIFRIQKVLSGTDIEIEPQFAVAPISPDERDILLELGVQRSSLLLTNLTIFVEGPSDRRFYQRFLSLYAKKKSLPEPIADLHYSFLQYGGSNLSHFGFGKDENVIRVDRLSGNEVCLICDRDRAAWKEKLRKQMISLLGERFICPSAIEVENLLGPTVIQAIVNHFEKRQVAELDDITEKDYANVRLGSFIDEKLGKNNKRGTYKEGSGTIKEKTDFCDKALKNLVDFDEISFEAQKATERLYSLIIRFNPQLRIVEN